MNCDRFRVEALAIGTRDVNEKWKIRPRIEAYRSPHAIAVVLKTLSWTIGNGSIFYAHERIAVDREQELRNREQIAGSRRTVDMY
jgi:hypothetical protein